MDSFRKEWAVHTWEEASFLSKFFYTWTLNIFKQDRKEQFTIDNIWGPPTKQRSKKLGDRLEKIWLDQLDRRKTHKTEPSLVRAVLLTFWKDISILSLIQLIISLAEVLLRPYLLGLLITSFSTDIANMEVFKIALQLLLLNFVSSILSCHYLFRTALLGMEARVAIVATVFRKSLKLSKTALNDVSPGQIVNLISNDVGRFELVAISAFFLWSSPLQTLIVGYFLYRDVGISGFSGMLVIGGVAIFQTYTAKLTSRFRRKIARETDQRLRLTDEILAGIQVIKLYAWEKPFAKLLEKARSAELKYVKWSNYMRGVYMAFNLSTTKIALVLTLSAYILSGFSLTTAEVFVIGTYYSILNHTMASIFVRGIQEVAECSVSLKRLQAFLLREEVDASAALEYSYGGVEAAKHDEPSEETPLKQESSQHEDVGNNKTTNDIALKDVANGNVSEPSAVAIKENGLLDLAIVVQDVRASWIPDRMVPTLMNLTFSVLRGDLIGLIGSVGAGKTSLLHLLMSELKQQKGKVFVNGTVSYASQESWIFSGSVRDNILLGLPYDKKRYAKVITAACLKRDFELFSEGDQTPVGERGASLSGGQKARISLARAIYRDADIYLLDDPLSAVDAHVAKAMFRNCFRGFLKGKTIILATHQLQFLDQVDKIIFLQVGQIKDIGRFEDLMNRGHDFTKVVENAQALFEPPAESVMSSPEVRLSRRFSESESASMMGSQISIGVIADDKDSEEEKQPLQGKNETYEGWIFIDYLRSGNAFWVFSIFFILLALAQFLATFSDYWVALWAKSFDKPYKKFNLNSTVLPSPTEIPLVNATESPIHNMTTTSFDNLTTVASNESLQLLNGTLNLNNSSTGWNNSGAWSDDFYMTVAAIAVGCLLVVAMLRGIVFMISSFKISSRLHAQMVKCALYTDLSYFNNNPSGTILNKFSKDLGATDESLPKVILDTSQTFSQVVGACINTLIVNYLFVIPMTIFIFASTWIRNYYMSTATNLKRLDNMSRGPIYTHLNTCLHGLTTARALKAQRFLKNAFDFHQDLHTACLFTYVSCQQGYGFALDLLSFAFISAIIFSCILGRGSLSGADLGLAISQSMMLTGMLQWGTRQSSEAVNMMTSVERLITFTTLPPEDPKEETKKIPPENWPMKGSIKLENISLRYNKEGPPALDNVSLCIFPGEKVGIVGRTGAGKSTLTSVLFRLAPIEGKCIIDGTDTSELVLQSLRSSLAIIPQNPVLFSGNLRGNIDPFLSHSDHELWSALEDIDLSEIAKDGKGLDSAISDCGNNLSVGQRQLICLARAVLKNRNIIVLDEATASVDPETDAQIQKTIRKRFANCTVITIAHRLNTIMDSDRILVMDAGRAVELDTPHNLLQNEDGHFYSLVQETGTQMATRLTNQAYENHLAKLKEDDKQHKDGKKSEER